MRLAEVTAVCCLAALASGLLLLQKGHRLSHLLGQSYYCCMDALTLIVHALELLFLMMSMASIHILAATFILLHKMTAMYILYGYYCLPFQSVGQMVMVDPSVLQNPVIMQRHRTHSLLMTSVHRVTGLHLAPVMHFFPLLLLLPAI